VVPASQWVDGRHFGSVAGETYYINVRNWSVDLNAVSCPTGNQVTRSLLRTVTLVTLDHY
jgi:hypothetical protein